MSDAAAARAVIEEYVAACLARSVERLKAIFHPDALTSGYLMDQRMIGSPQPFYDALTHAPQASGAPSYTAKITAVEVVGRIATVTLEEKGFLGLNFTDFFHLLNVDNKWLILSKTFTTT